MCRFLLVRSKNKIKPQKLLKDFALMCQKSRTLDGDWQGDGWGIAWKISNWQVHKSLNPIWEDKKKFMEFPKAKIFAIHARSAGFPQHKGNMEFNQPYVEEDLCFVFNGMLHGVTLDKPLPGRIGAEKIFSFVKIGLKTGDASQVLKNLDTTMIAASKKIEGLNVGIIYRNQVFVLCEYVTNTEYFGLKYYQDDNLILVCSEEMLPYKWQTMKRGEILTI